MKLDEKFYQKDTINLAKDLLGKVIVRKIKNKKLLARIVETEAYTGFNDRASHTFAGRKTKRTEIMYEKPGFIYIYLIYGMYCMFNIVSGKKELGQAVLIRAVEAINEFDSFSENRFSKEFNKLSSYQKKNLTNGPGKVTKALRIDINDNKKFLLDDEIYLIDDGFKDFDIIETTRIGIDYAKEAKDFKYRFYIKDNANVSVK